MPEMLKLMSQLVYRKLVTIKIKYINIQS